jgi:2,4-dienoyl-CoA reductase-like NADH-dependent reductase (Old Yellow Enzyme family)
MVNFIGIQHNAIWRQESTMNNSTVSILGSPLTLPCGTTIKNRFFKSAMSEILGDDKNRPTKALNRLYERWANGGTGVIVTGNVMVDRKALGEPRNVVLDREEDLPALSAWAESGKKNGAHIWVQLNHPGRQSPKFLSPEPVAPSAIPYSSELRHMFNPPTELTEEGIRGIIEKFTRAASLAKQAGFTGVQIHGAHGYLVSQFLSPLYNQRLDQWGGSIENRMRFLLEIIRAVRAEVGPEFPVGVKLNSSDFKNKGFTEDEALMVVKAISEEGVDLIEISGGTYESPAMMGGKKKSGESRPFFIDFAERAVASVSTPIVLTGGFRTSSAMVDAMTYAKIAMVGIGRPLVVDPEMPKKILSGEPYQSTVKPLTTGIAFIDRVAMLEITWYENQMRYLGQGLDPKPHENVYSTVFNVFRHMGGMAFKRRRA